MPIPPRDNEHVIALPNGRQLAYASMGNKSSRTLFLFFSGLFSIGSISRLPPIVEKLDAHMLAPTPTGMGKTSPRIPGGRSYAANLVDDIRRLIEAEHPDGIDALYIGGGSYGTVMAQILYGAGYDVFPDGAKIKGCLLVSGFSPYKYDTDYAQSLTWTNWVAVGPPSMMPFRMLQRAMRPAIALKLRTVEDAKVMIMNMLYSKLEAEERATLDQHLAENQMTFDEHVTYLAENMVRSVEHTWDGFMEVSEVLHSDWGFDPRTLDEAHQKPILLVSALADEVGGSRNRWMLENYKNAVGRDIKGGHAAGLAKMGELWQELVDLCGSHNGSGDSEKP